MELCSCCVFFFFALFNSPPPPLFPCWYPVPLVFLCISSSRFCFATCNSSFLFLTSLLSLTRLSSGFVSTSLDECVFVCLFVCVILCTIVRLFEDIPLPLPSFSRLSLDLSSCCCVFVVGSEIKVSPSSSSQSVDQSCFCLWCGFLWRQVQR